MKIHNKNEELKFSSRQDTNPIFGLWRIGVKTMLSALLAIMAPSLQAVPHHDIAAANFDVSLSTGVPTVTAVLSINDMQVRAGAAKGNYPVQIGPDVTDDATTGVLLGAISQNGRDNGETSANRSNINYCFPHAGLTSVLAPTAGYNLYSDANASVTTNVPGKYNINVAGAWFPFSSWLGGRVYRADNVNPAFNTGITNDTLTGSPGLTYANTITEPTAGNYILDLTHVGIDSHTDGILLVNSGKAEINWANCAVNPTNGTWDVRVKDGTDNGAGAESDYFCFVFIPKTNTSVFSGRFLGDGSIDVYNGSSPRFTVSSNSVGTYELKIPGFNPTNGVLIVSPDQSGSKNLDNMVTYEANPANDGWIIQTRDYPGIGSPLEALDPTEIVASFVFIPADNDLPNLVLAPATISMVEGKTNGYSVALNTQPTDDVTVNITSSDTAQGGTVSPSTLVFTSLNWSNAQTVTVTGADDLIVDGETVFRITNTVVSADPNYGILLPTEVSVKTLDNEPLITLPIDEVLYGIGSGGIGINGLATISDPNTTNYNGSTMVVTLTANGASDDRLEVRNTGTDPGQISVSGNTVSHGGVAIATFTGGVGTTPLSVTFNASSTPEGAEALLRSVTFRNISATPALDKRTVSVAVTHPDGGTGSASSTIRFSEFHAISFQEGADYGYGTFTGVGDCHIQLNSPGTSFPAGGGSGLFIDFPTAGGNSSHVLLRFDNIFGNGPGQIPSNAIIASAELFLNITDTGHGSPLYRMVKDWDPNATTWSTLGFGVEEDDRRTEYDSQLSMETAITTGVGLISIGVTPDVQEWANGTANYGWAMPGWVGNNNGTGISPSESPNVALRPRLRVLWVPAGTVSANFRQGIDGYTGARDTRLRQVSPDTDDSTATALYSDWSVTGSTGDNEHVLIRFDDIIGYNPGQIRPGSQIHAAVVDLASRVSAAPGAGGKFHAMLAPWQDTDTWNSLVNGVTADGVEAASVPSATAGSSALTPLVQAAFHPFEVTADVQSWVSGTGANYGWVILPWPNGNDGWGIGSSEQTLEQDRPQLRVYYTPGPAAVIVQSVTHGGASVTIKFAGEIGTQYSVRRAGTVEGTYSIIGSATVQPDGVATFVDNAPLPGAAFYRVSNP